MRLRLLLAALLFALPLSASAASLTGTVNFNAQGVRIGPPIIAAPGDVVTLSIAVNPQDLGIGAYGFAFDAAAGVQIQSLNAALGGSSSISADKRLFSFNNALSQDLTSPTEVAVMVFNVLAGAAPGDSVSLRAGGEIVRGDFSSVEPGAPSPGAPPMIQVIPEPGTALLIGAGLMGLGLVRRRSA